MFTFRTFVFTYLIRGGKPTPSGIFLAALFFCLYNGYLQGCYLAEVAQYPSNWISSPSFLFGKFISYKFKTLRYLPILRPPSLYICMYKFSNAHWAQVHQ